MKNELAYQRELDEIQQQKIEKFIQILKMENEKFNLISRKMTASNLNQLIVESIMIDSLIKNKTVADAGSGNGLLGIPLSIINQKRHIILVESKLKKANFLREVVLSLGLNQTEIYHVGMREFFIKNGKNRTMTLVTRGFPDNQMLIEYLKRRFVNELILITSMNKIEKIKKEVENLKQKIYNIPFRENIKIIKMENVSRET